MTILSFACAAALMLWPQGAAPPPAMPFQDCISAQEQKKLSENQKIDGRIKVYRAITERFHKTVESVAQKQKFEEIAPLLKCWQEALSDSLKDVDANINRKKKSGALIQYEISIRKAILDMEDVQIKAPVQQQGDFDSWIARATIVRKRFVDILFQR